MTKNIQLPPNSYVIVENPVIHNSDGSKPLTDEYGCYKLDFGETQVRTSDQWQDSFPLYPGEVLLTPKPEPMLVVSKDEAIRIQVERDYTSANGTVMRSGQIYQRQGPLTYVPRKEEYFLRKIQKTVIKQNNALELLATNEFVDRDGVKRTNGERWFYDVVGSFWPGVYETIQKTISGVVLNDNKSIHILGLNDFKDQFGVERKAGQKWLVTNKMSSVFLPSVYEKVLKTVNIITLSNREYIRVTNPYSTEKGCIQRGCSEIRMGEQTFFEHPDECLGEKERIKVLSSDESMVLKANREYQDKFANVTRKAGEKWLLKGPGEYYPSIDVNVLETRHDLALDASEGVYIRDLLTGEVRAVIGENVVLSADEEYWMKPLTDEVSDLVNRKQDKAAYYVVTLPVGDNEAVQIFDYSTNEERVVFGTDLVKLQPHEEFKVLKLSGGIPKQEGYEKKICIPLGQNNFDDEIIVVTQDHAALRLSLSYSGQFIKDDSIKQNPSKLFNIHDYVGIVCKTVASRIRGTVSQRNYNDFHLQCNAIVKKAIFGANKDLLFDNNNFVLNQCDVKKIEPADIGIRKKLENNTALS